MSSLDFQHGTPAFRTFCGPQALQALPRELDRLGVTRAVIFCGGSMRRHEGALDHVVDAVGARLVEIFDGVQAHSPLPAVESARTALERVGADGVIAVGGGSAIVTARAATILLAEKADIRELCTRRVADGRLHSPRLLTPKLPQWVVPTTPTTAYAKAGSAVRDPASGERLALFDPSTRSQGIFIDPEVALTAPEALAAASALNAFAMAVEGLQSNFDDPLAEALLSQALRLLATWLPELKKNPNEPEPRMRLMLAALLCGQGSDYVGGGLAQSLSHAAGPRSSVANGIVEVLLLPHTMRFNAPVTEAGIRRVGRALGLVDGASGSTPSEAAITAVSQLVSELGLPPRLREVGVTEEALPEIVGHAMDDWWLTRTPRPVGVDELTRLLHAAW